MNQPRRGRLKTAAGAFVSNAVNGNLRRAQLSFLGAWTAEWAFTVALGIVAYRDGGATAVGLVGLLRMVPSAVVAPLALRSRTGDAGSEYLSQCLRSAASLPGRLELSSPSMSQCRNRDLALFIGLG
jgi:hypothetical protein